MADVRNYRPVPLEPSASCEVRLTGRVLDVGIGGARLAGLPLLAPGVVFDLVFALPGPEDDLVRARCVVERSGAGGGHDGAGDGLVVRFQEIPIEDRLRIIRFVRSRYEGARRHVRLRVDLPARLGEGTDRRVLDLSVAGAYVATAAAPEPGTPVGLRIRLPGAGGEDTWVSTPSVVRRVITEQETAQEGVTEPGIGVEFVGLPDESRVYIRDYLERLERAGG